MRSTTNLQASSLPSLRMLDPPPSVGRINRSVFFLHINLDVALETARYCIQSRQLDQITTYMTPQRP